MAGPARKPHKKPSERGSKLSLSDYLQKILTARVYDVAIESPLEPARTLSRRLGNQVLLKREDQQPVFSFKLARCVQQDGGPDARAAQAAASSALRPATTPRASRWRPGGWAARR